MWLSIMAPRLSWHGNQLQQQVACAKPVWDTSHPWAGEAHAESLGCTEVTDPPKGTIPTLLST